MSWENESYLTQSSMHSDLGLCHLLLREYIMCPAPYVKTRLFCTTERRQLNMGLTIVKICGLKIFRNYICDCKLLPIRDNLQSKTVSNDFLSPFIDCNLIFFSAAYLSLVVRKPVFRVSDTNHAVQQQKMDISLKFRI